jgi:hypothetical protein
MVIYKYYINILIFKLENYLELENFCKKVICYIYNINIRLG